MSKAPTQEAKHTPGPWRVGNPSEYGTHNPCHIFGADGAAIAQCYGVPIHTTLEEVDEKQYAEGLTNARLIANLPALLESHRELKNALTAISVRKNWTMSTHKDECSCVLCTAFLVFQDRFEDLVKVELAKAKEITK